MSMSEGKEEAPKVMTIKPALQKEAGDTHIVKGWFVEVKEEGQARIVVFDQSRNRYEFPEEETCNKFLEDLRKQNPGAVFRKVSREIVHAYGEW